MLLAASLRRDSVNKKLINVTANLLRARGVLVDLVDFAEFEMPLYNGDYEEELGLPEKATIFIKRLKEADGLVLASPEYNFSVPGALKNLIDWVSRVRPISAGWGGMPILLLSASPSLAGGSRGLLHTRVGLEVCGAYVYPKQFSVSDAYNAFNEAGEFIDEKRMESLDKLLIEFNNYVKAIKKIEK